MVLESQPSSTADERALTRRQREIAAYVERQIRHGGRPPTRADIAKQFGINRATAQQHLVALERRGVIYRTTGARGLQLSRSVASRHGALPILGRIPAGVPLAAVEDIEDWLDVSPALFRRVPDVLLRVTGDSMRDAGILDGDLIAVVLQGDADSGQIVVARLGEEITVKRLWRVDHEIELRPANPVFAPIRLAAGTDFSVEGVVVGVIRRY